MKRFTAIAFALLLFSGTASAQLPQNGLLGQLLGPNGVVQSLVTSAEQVSLKPTIDALAGNSGLIQGSGGASLNMALTGLLVIPPDAQAVSNGLSALLLGGPNGGLLGGLGGALSGSGALAGSFGSGLGAVSGGGQGLSADEVPLQNVDPSTQAALANNVTLQGL